MALRDRRAHERLPEKHEVAVTVLEADDAPELVNRTFFCPTEDISMTGLRLCVHRRVPVGSKLALRIAFLDKLRSFKHEGYVVWVRRLDNVEHPFALGVQYTRLQRGAVDAWRAMIDDKVSATREDDESSSPAR